MKKRNYLLLILTVFTLGFFTRNVTSFVLAHGGNTNLIHGCVRPITGLLRIVGINDVCGQNETPLDWRKAPEPGTDFPIICPHCDFNPNTGFPSDYFTGKDITGAVFVNSDMNGGLNFTGTNLSNTLLQAASLDSANFTNANLTNATMESTNLTNVIWSNTTCPDGTNSDNNGNTCEGHLTP